MSDRPTDPEVHPADPLPPAGPPPESAESLRRNWWLLLVLGILLILGGIGAIVLPVAASLAVTIAVGLAMLVGGAVKGVHAFRCRRWRARAWSIFSAVLYLVGGMLLLFNPLAGMISLTAVMIVLIGADAILRIVMALRLRPDHGWGWMLIGGVAGVALAIAMTVLLPWLSLTFLGVLAGIALIFEGWGFAWLAMATKRGGRPRRHATV